ncbi:MAG TPA: lipase maturation factor family protein, partial [Polyangiales bacterium]|nr:lipase maturation factor family protein [Polyangiales bacterium]
MAVTLASASPSGTAPILRPFDPSLDSGPGVAGVFQRVFAAVLLVAWASLASQVELLAGSEGLAPAADLLASAREQGLGWLDLPTVFWLGDGDAWLQAGAWLGMALALLALCGVRPRTCFALSAPLYLSYAAVCGEFLAFQWDNLLIESALLAACLPATRPSRLAHFVLRALLFKLYFESGIAKWQSHLHDWQDGSAMLHYYETAPLPAALAFYAHHLPPFVHQLESWGALLLELPLPFLIWGPRRARSIAFVALTGFQLVNTATANYGFFTYMTLALHLFLISDTDVDRARKLLRRTLERAGVRADRNVSSGSGSGSGS